MRPELLAPAGGPEALRAAVQCGADAVYLGFGAFNARRNAKNFTEAEFRAAVRYCHGRGVKVYLTLNTLLFDRELSAAAQTAVLAAQSVWTPYWYRIWACCRLCAPLRRICRSTPAPR